MKIRGQIVDPEKRETYYGEIIVEEGIITRIHRLEGEGGHYIMPGFIDAHIHIESSMMVPSEFARLAVLHGTVACVSDPHEIANVMGMEGVQYMLDNAAIVPLKFYFGAPSCVPATPFETSGATLGAEEVEELLRRPEIKYLSEMMNFPGVLDGDPEVGAKLATAKNLGKPVDGHAPGLRGEDARRYIEAGISTDHECSTREEALDKLQHGMKILIREGSAARNFDALISLLAEYPDQIMFCSDDKHPDDLLEGHINTLAARAVTQGQDPYDIIQAACINPILHYGLEVGRLREGDPADFIEVEDLQSFAVLSTYIQGRKVASYHETLIDRTEAPLINRFHIGPLKPDDFAVPTQTGTLKLIGARDGAILTDSLRQKASVEGDRVISDPENDVLKIAVVNRYEQAPPALGFIRGFGFKAGAIAGSVAHDSHNIVAVGVDDASLCEAVNLVIEHKGGISAVCGDRQEVLALPVAGIMCNRDGFALANTYADIDGFVKRIMGSPLKAPFMTLSFMALLVIPSLKMSDKGLFDGDAFQLTELFNPDPAS